MVTQSWTEIIASSFHNAWASVISFLPTFIGALILLVIGLLIASAIGRLVEKLFKAIKIDEFVRKIDIGKFAEKGGFQIRVAWFLGRLVYWFLIIVIILAISDILKFAALSSFLREVLFYIPNIIVAILILLAAIVLANFLRSVVKKTVEATKFGGAGFLATLTWWVVMLFGLAAALVQLKVAVTIINTLVIAVIAAIGLAVGLAFGLGGKDEAARLLAKLRKNIEEGENK
jgi:MFS family permease